MSSTKELLDSLERDANHANAILIYNDLVKQTNSTYENTKIDIDSFICTHIPLPSNGNLYLGNLRSLDNSFYKNYKFDYIVSIYDLEPSLFKQDADHEVYPLNDSSNPEDIAKLSIVLDSICKKIHENLYSGKNVLVHCFGGVSRSATVVIDYIARYHINCTRDTTEPTGIVRIVKNCDCIQKAIAYVKSYRKIVCPNPGFIGLLLDRHSKLN